MMNFTVSFRPSTTALLFAVGALAISLLGSLPPARRAARLNIIEAVGVD
jgi:putative ABC transport system permease protein